MNRNLLLVFSILFYFPLCAQFRVSGKITNAKMEPLAFASVQVKGNNQGVVTKEDGTYSLELDEGNYELVVTMIGYKTYTSPLVISKKNIQKDIILEEADATSLSEVTVKGKSKDKAEEYIRNVIRNKEAIQQASGAYSCKMYIKAVQQDSMEMKKGKKPLSDSMLQAMRERNEMNQMALAEIVIQLDVESSKRIKEERTGVKKRGNTESLFYLSATEGDFSFYNNLVNIPSLSQTPFISPLSYSGLLAYRYKTLRTEIKDGKKYYTIGIKPRQLSNATVEGEMVIAEGSWVVLHTKIRLPSYHLAAYDFFEVEQQYAFVQDKAWMITRQEFTYKSISDKRKASGHTLVSYADFELNKQFDRKHFGTELSSASLEAYKRDSSFWEANRTQPLTEKEVRFIHYKDSVYAATHSKAYLDSIDKKTNKLVWQNLAFRGQVLNNHVKRRNMRFPAIPEVIQPFQLGGVRIEPTFSYFKTWESRKNLGLFADISYGIRNKDINGSLRVNRMYNPFNRGMYSLRLQKNFDYIFNGDAWINMIQRGNIYLNQGIGIGHSLEIANGLFLYTDADMAFRRSVSDYKTGDGLDSLFGDVLDNNRAPAFASYNALYGSLRLEYTPWQRYIREPREKVILGSSWPTFYVSIRKGVPGIFKSEVDFDYLELGLRQSVKLGTMGTSSYTIRTGSFLSQKDLRLVDYKFQRRGDPILFLNPAEAFQSLDSTFATFKRFYEGHYIHEFNGAFLNKIPFFKKIGLREVAGAGFLIAKERNLRYAELFTGVERVFKYPFNLLGKFKLGIYVVGSVANQFRNPVQFKVGITAWDKKRGKWF